jgi:K+-transporting ATPase ATPase A chain
LAPVERLLYRLSGVNQNEDMRWTDYAIGLLVFNLLGTLAVFVLQRMQAHLPFNPQNLPGVSPDSAFNTAVSFATNTNWQGYGGETTMSYLTQMHHCAICFTATGMAVLVALILGFAEYGSIGNFGGSTRSVYILMPLS